MSSVQDPLMVNFAASALKSRALGPGNRAVLWVRGCERHCKGCISPYWWSTQPEKLVSTQSLADRLLVHNPEVRGITISGGEPFLQAPALASLLRLARTNRTFDTIIYSGYTLHGLRESGLAGVEALLDEVDILIDGEYRFDLPANDGIRGSLNQVIHFLTDRIQPEDFYANRNPLELHAKDGHAFMIGVPTKKQLAVFDQSVTQLANLIQDGVGLTERKLVIHEF